jgi:hypothetical protein
VLPGKNCSFSDEGLMKSYSSFLVIENFGMQDANSQ